MPRVIFDTNIYGKLILEQDAAEIERKIIEDIDFIVYGFHPIRKEIRNIPKVNKLSRKARILLLGLYDRITENRFYENSIEITSLAKKYYNCYRNLGGIYSWDTSICIDFMIVACASFYGLDIVYSDDRSTLLGRVALKAYKHINFKENFKTPNFFEYNDLLKRFRI